MEQLTTGRISLRRTGTYAGAPVAGFVTALHSFESLAPGFFDVEGALFLSSKGDVLGRVEGYYDQRITQRLNPRVAREAMAALKWPQELEVFFP